MYTRMWGYAFVGLLAVFLCGVGGVLAQQQPNVSQAVPLTVQAGTPFDVALDKPLPIKEAGVPVEGHLVEPVYVFDHLVVPAGSHILGQVAQVDDVPRKKRAIAIANGDFTPLRTAHVEFNTLVLKDGSRIPLHTVVSQGAPRLVHLSAGEQSKKKGRVGQAVDQAKQQVKDQEQQAIEEIKAPGKMKRLGGDGGSGTALPQASAVPRDTLYRRT